MLSLINFQQTKLVLNFHLSKLSQRDSASQNFIAFKARFITYLALQGNKISEQSIKSLVKTGWKFIQTLNLSKNHINGASLHHFKQSDWKYLKRLNLSLNPIRNKGVQNLMKCSFPKLQRLIMKKTLVTSSCFKCLPKAQWKGLKQLNFCECQLGVIDLSFLGHIEWNRNCMIDLHTDDSRPVFGWCNSLSKVPISMRELKIFLCNSHTALNSQISIDCLKNVFPNTANFHMLWSTDIQGGGVQYFMASSDDN